MNKLSEKVELTSTKGLTKDLIGKYNILNGYNYFNLNVSQNYLVFQTISSYFTTEKDGKSGSLQSKGISGEIIMPPSTADISFKLEISYIYGRGRIDFKRICLKQYSVSFLLFMET